MNNDGSGFNPSVNESNNLALSTWLIEKYQPQTVMDLGTGLGYLVRSLLDYGIDAYGVEGCQELQSKTSLNSENKHRITYSDLRFITSPKVSLTTSFEVIEHIPRADLKDFFDTVKLLSDIHVCSIHTMPPEHKEHQTIMSRSEWEAYFDKNGIGHKYLDDFPITYWKCSAFFELDMRGYVNK